ncbi:MAG TPA: alpha/beta hydrolase [Rhizomicrobium sp.]|nr:alpha/beta hydrolase [Rhizomicrobium sp.]
MTVPVRKALPLPEGEVSCLQWEGTGPFLHFAHATGFNAETYRGLLAPLADRLAIAACDQRGHGFSTLPTAPGLAKDWIVYRDDLVRILERLDQGPALLSGHSMGGTVSLMAAALHPERVRGLVLVEPVMIPRFAGMFLRLARLGGGNPGPDLADRAEQRRDTFPSFDAALAAYTGRGAFKSWRSETLADYLHGGLVDDPEHHAVTLACKPSWEAQTFRATPFGMARLVRRVNCPVTVVYGTIASTCRDSEADIFRRAGARVVKVDGASHFLPMEHPDRVRDEIARLADTLKPAT